MIKFEPKEDMEYICEHCCQNERNHILACPEQKGDPDTIAPMPAADLLRIRIELEALITEREGMIAENRHRSDGTGHGSHSVAYTDDAFFELQKQITALLEKLK